MFGESLDLSDVLKKLKRADEALTEFIAPLWPGVKQVVAWLEGKPRLYTLTGEKSVTDYYLLGTEGTIATPIRVADTEEVRQYHGLLEKARVVLLDYELAFPASFAERLQGITAPRPIFFANERPLTQAIARYDGINLLFDHLPGAEKSSPLAGLFSESSIFTPGELLDVPGQGSAEENAAQAQAELHAHSDLATQFRLLAVLEPCSASLLEWARRADNTLHVVWHKQERTVTVSLHSDKSPISTGICLPGAKGFNSGAMTRMLLEHALDSWC